MLWIALFIPDLPLQLAERARESNGPCVIAEGPVTRPFVRCANQAARACGIAPGMAVAAARVLNGKLRVLPHEETLDAEALHNLACWAGQFTPNVAVQPGEGLLLEVESTLQLHGGLKALLRRVCPGLEGLGYRAAPGVAPTPRAAWLLAKARHHGLTARMCTQAALLPQRLASLPLVLLDWPTEVLATLQALGVRRLGQCLNLPRDGFISRFGAPLRLELDQAIGTAPDPRSWFMPPDRFKSHLDFGFDVENALMLLFPLKRLLQELEGFLRGRGAGVQEWQLILEHRKQQKMQVTLGLSAPERSSERLLALAREKLAQMTLTAPVLGLGIAADRLAEFEESSRSFVPDPGTRAIGWHQLVDKLAARLGKENVQHLHARDDHRPEAAWRASSSPAKKSAAPVLKSPRPLLLLETPRVLPSEDGKPLCQGRLQLLAGPERIESGWWDGSKARRDYYVARNAGGETFWIYHEHKRTKEWYLHGVFA